MQASFVKFCELVYCPADFDPRVGPDMNVIARFFMAGVLGDISFYQPERGANVEITVDFQKLEQFYPQSFKWSIREYPVPYSFFPCADLGAVYAPIPCPANTSQNCVYGNLGERLGPILSTEINRTQTFSDSVLDLYGPNTPNWTLHCD